MKNHLFILILALCGICTTTSAQVRVSGLADFVARNVGEDDYSNLTFKKQSNFHSVRTRLFFDAPVGDNASFFTQILIDDQIFALYGAYLRVSRLAGPYLNLQVGYIPSTVGSYGERTYSNVNPLIGTPLLYNYHSHYDPGYEGPIRSVEDMLAGREQRSIYGLPVLYDNCWNTGLELYGVVGKLDYSLGLLSGSVSLPRVQQVKNTPQVTTHLTWHFSPGLVVGTSAFYGTYLGEGIYGDTLPAEKDYEDYINGGIGYEFAGVFRFFEIRSESYYAYWEHPYIPTLKVVSGYVEAKYKFYPRWYVAGRYDYFEPGKMTTASGTKEPWDYPARRIEAGIGFHANRQMLVKLVGQFNRVPHEEELESDLYALQLSVMF